MTTPLKPKATLDEMSQYLTEVDGYLLSFLGDQSSRLDHIEEIAQVLISSGADPVEEFGPAETYANDLAAAVGRSLLPSWLRITLASLGGFLLTMGLINLLVELFPGPGFFTRDAPQVAIDIPIVLYSIIVAATAVLYISRRALRLQAKLIRSTSRAKYNIGLGLLYSAPILLAELVLQPIFSVTVSSQMFAIGIAALLAALGSSLIGASGFPLLMIARYRNQRRPSSVFRYRLFEDTPRVQLLHPTLQTIAYEGPRNL